MSHLCIGGPADGAATALVEEARAINEATGYRPFVHVSLVLAVWRGQEARAEELITAGIQDATGDRRPARSLAEYARTVLYNGLGRYPDAIDAGRRACRQENLGVHAWALAELVEAGVRGGRADIAAEASQRLERRTPAGGTDWALGIQARSRALLADSDAADPLYREALERLARSRIALHLARTQLVYGEWLRRSGRRVAAREQLRAAHGMFSSVGADGFAERTHRELLATGESVRKRSAEMPERLTAQEAEIARLAAIGDTNPEIGARLFISPRTVEWHLRKVFTKLGISSRRELHRALS